MAGGGGQQGAAAPAQGQIGQPAAQPQGGGVPQQQQQPQINPQTIQDVQNLIQQYQSSQRGGAQRGFADGGFAGSNYASPNQNFMTYPQQGQPNQPMLGAPTPMVQNDGGPDVTGNVGGNNMGFDGSGSDSGVGGRPVTSTQTPLQLGNKPLGLGQFQQPQGLQIQGNPTSSLVQRPLQR